MDSNQVITILQEGKFDEPYLHELVHNTILKNQSLLEECIWDLVSSISKCSIKFQRNVCFTFMILMMFVIDYLRFYRMYLNEYLLKKNLC